MSSIKRQFTINSQKYPIYITIGFLLIASYMAFFVHDFWTFDIDGKYYLDAGKEILNGNGKNVGLLNAPAGGPVFYAILNNFFTDGFILLKTIAVLSATGIVLFSYYTIKNIFDTRMAIVGQLIFAFNPWFLYFSFQAENEMLPFFLAIVSLYLITKKNPQLFHFSLAGFLLGIAFMFRFQIIIEFFSILVFILILKENFIKKLKVFSIFSLIFFVTISPFLIYNFYTYDTFIDSTANWYIADGAQFSTPEWREQISLTVGIFEAINVDVNIFLENYFYNSLYNLPKWLFNYNDYGNISLIPVVPFIGMISILGGLVYSLKIGFNKTDLSILGGASILVTILVFAIGDIYIHFSAIFLIPLLILGIKNIRKIESNFLPILILPVIFIPISAQIRLFSGEHFFLLLIWIAVLNAIFIVKVIPRIYSYIANRCTNKQTINSNPRIFLVIFIILIITLNVGFSSVLYRANSSGIPFESVEGEFSQIFNNKKDLGVDFKNIGDILNNDLQIENKYIMAPTYIITEYTNGKLVFAQYNEGKENDSIKNFITREYWTEWEIFRSNVASQPMDKQNLIHPIPEYLIFVPHEGLVDKQNDYLITLGNPNQNALPSYLEVIYQSERPNGPIVYKIHLDKMT